MHSMRGCGGRALAFVEKLCFERVAATQGERRAASLLEAELGALGAAVKIEAFEQPCGKVKHAALTGFGKSAQDYGCEGYALSKSTPADGMEAALQYVEQLQPQLLEQAHGKIVLFDGKLTNKAYRQIVESGAVGFISHTGCFSDGLHAAAARLKDAQLTMRRIPGVNLHTRDAIRLIASGTKSVRMALDLEESTANSHNVVAEIPGTTIPDEIIAITAHYDTVPGSIGAYDNASGTAVALELFRAFLKAPPGRTLRFIWCGSEETGLQGSKAYTRMHARELAQIRLVVNFDLLGAVLAEDTAVVMAEPGAEAYLRDMARTLSHPLRVHTDVLPGDCTRFVDCGVPAVGLGRYGTHETASMHDERDTMCFMSAEALEHTAAFAHYFIRHVADAAPFPIGRDIPADLKARIADYLQK